MKKIIKDELMPLTCKGRDTWGGYKLTLIDTMDTLLLTGDLRRFRKVEQIVRAMSFDIDKVKHLLISNFLFSAYLELFLPGKKLSINMLKILLRMSQFLRLISG